MLILLRVMVAELRQEVEAQVIEKQTIIDLILSNDPAKWNLTEV